MMLVVALSWVDRSLPGVLLEPMRASLGFTDTQVSLVNGLAFAIGYGLFTLPVSWAADRFNRVLILAAGLTLWCVMTVGFGLASAFLALFIMRMGVGIGEATLHPTSLPLLSELFPRAELPRALSLFSLGSAVGVAVAFIGGGALHDAFAAAGRDATFGLEPWRATFVALGAAGLLIVPLILRAPEPRKGRRAARAGAVGFWSYLKEASPYMAPLFAGVGLYAVYVQGYLGWTAPYFTRIHGWSVAQTGAYTGLALVVTGASGALAGGLFTAWWTRQRGGRDSVMLSLIIFAALIAPLAVIGPLMNNPYVAFGFVCVQLFLTFAAGTILPAAMINAAPSHLRARFTAFNVLASALFGGALGPTAFAVLTDFVFRDPMKLPLSLSIGSAALFALIIPVFVLAAHAYPRALEAAAAREAAQS